VYRTPKILYFISHNRFKKVVKLGKFLITAVTSDMSENMFVNVDLTYLVKV